MNQYEMAMAAIVSILAKYDSDQLFPVLGFGAKIGGAINHCFQCGATEEVKGVNGVLEAYNQVFKSGLVMSGPTVFTEVMEAAAARAQSSLEAAQRRGQQAYTVLLILTDGEVSDVRATAQCLNRISDSPLSIVIVGVGNANFSGMQFLDDSAAPGKRDIAQFVQFNRHASNSVELTSETLREIPDQLVQYFQRKGIPPLPPLQRSDSTVSLGEAEDEIDLSLNIQEDEIVITGGGDDFVNGFAKSRV
jgi:Copine